MSKASWWVIGGSIITFCIGAFLWQCHSFSPAEVVHRLEPLRSWVKSFGLWAPVVYIGLFILRPIALLPSAPVTFLGGLLFGIVNGVIFVLIGSALSSALEFNFIRHFASAKIINFVREKAPKIANATEKRGFLTVFLVRFIPNVAFDLQNCALALTPVRFSDYFWGTLVGCFPAILFYVFLGNQALFLIKSVR